MPDPSSRLQRRVRGLIAGAAGFRLLALLIVAVTFVAPAGVLADGMATGSPLLRVRTVVAQTVVVAATQTLTGDIQPRYLSEISFRTNGKIASRAVDVGRHVAADEVLATLDPASPAIQPAGRTRCPRIGSSAADPGATELRPATRPARKRRHDAHHLRQCEQSLRTAVAGMETAKAGLGTAEEQLGFTSLQSGVAGVITRRDAEVGQVVQAGQAVFILAQDGPRDAVFDVYEALLAESAGDKKVDVALQADPAVHVTGEVREIAPVVDPSSGTVKVKVGLATAPPGMSLGAIVVGTGRLQPHGGVVLPWSALFRSDSRPAVWVMDPQTNRVSLKNVSVSRYADDTLVISGGISSGEHVVVAGI